MVNTMDAANTVGLVALVPGLASATRVRSTLDTLCRQAEAVVLGEVHGVAIHGEHRYADISVARVVKGDEGQLQHVIAEATWRCAVSDAVRPGSRVVLFLGKQSTTQPLPKKRDFRYINRTRSADVELPASVADEVKRHSMQVVLTTDVFARYLATLD
jgi:hypothetical protein